jgi:hypothetical protein
MSTTTLDSVTNSLAHLSTADTHSSGSKKSSSKERDKSPKHKEKQKEKEKSKHKSKHENGESSTKSDGTGARKESPRKHKKHDADEDPAKKKQNQSTNKHNEMNGHNNNNMNSIINTDPRLAKPAAAEYEVPNFVNTEPIENFYTIGREIGRSVIHLAYSLPRIISPPVSNANYIQKNL